MAIRRDALATRREVLGYTQETLAHQLGVELSTIGRWERGTLTPQPWRRPDLAKVLKLTLEELDRLLSPPQAVAGSSLVTRREVMVDAAILAGAVMADPVAGASSDQSSQDVCQKMSGEAGHRRKRVGTGDQPSSGVSGRSIWRRCEAVASGDRSGRCADRRGTRE